MHEIPPSCLSFPISTVSLAFLGGVTKIHIDKMLSDTHVINFIF